MATITYQPFFTTDAGETAMLYTFRNEAGMEVDISSYGGAIVAVRVPDRNGVVADVVLGFDDYNGYHSKKYFLGVMVGRCCNRIAKGNFTLNGKEYQLACNDGGINHLHGGTRGLESKLLQCEIVTEEDQQKLQMKASFADGEEGYPGGLSVTITVWLSDKNELGLHYHAVSDADTLCNLTNHSYFNLAGHTSGTILNHQLQLEADAFVQTDAQSIPTGNLVAVEGTPMDFRTFHTIGERIETPYDQLKAAKGYDHNWVLREGNGKLAVAAQLYEPISGRMLTCITDQPGIQVYTGNYIDGSAVGKEGYAYQARAGIALETQYFPDAIHHPEWDSPIVRAGEVYDHTTIYRFDVKA